MKPRKIISGGQTGVDQAALRAAKRVGLPTGGWMPKGWRTEAGPRPEFAERYGMLEHVDWRYPPRTWKNVGEADVTLILGDRNSPGCSLTRKYCTKAARASLWIPLWQDDENIIVAVVRGLSQWQGIVNIAGNREESQPGIGAWAEELLVRALTVLARPE